MSDKYCLSCKFCSVDSCLCLHPDMLKFDKFSGWNHTGLVEAFSQCQLEKFEPRKSFMEVVREFWRGNGGPLT